MRSHRIVIFITGVLIALIAAAPAAGQSTLLSGYGGPGQGNQAILGAVVVKGSGGGGSSGAGSGAASGTGGETSSASSGEDGSEPSLIAPNKPAVGSSSAGSPGAQAGSDGHSGHPVGPRTSTRHASGAAVQAARQAPASFYPAAERVPAGQSAGALGLSGADVVYILLAVAALVSIGLFTKRVGAEAGRPGVGG